MAPSRTFLSAFLLLFPVQGVFAAELGTAFTYQGRLVKDGVPVSDTCSFTFGLWDAATLGNPKGNSPTGPLAVLVHEGLFSASLDFGPAAIDGTARWLEITVQCPGDATATTLTPRQELKPAPHALALPGLYTQQNVTSPNIIGGFHGNFVSPGVVGATVSGGGQAGDDPDNNRVMGSFGTVGGGEGNQAGEDIGNPNSRPHATVGGGRGNIASDSRTTIGGGSSNTASGYNSTIGGGVFNTTSGPGAFVGGGEQNTASESRAAVCGGADNEAIANSAFVGGGSLNTASGQKSTVSGGTANQATDLYATVGGGLANRAGGNGAAVSGGAGNQADGAYATIAGGSGNTADANFATVAGGQNNTAGTSSSSFGGGDSNTALGSRSTVPGGSFNAAGGDYSLAGGRRAKIRSATQSGDSNGDEGTFVWADSTDADFASTGPNQFLIRTGGGMGINTNTPAEALDVSGNIHASGTIASGSSITIDGTAHSISSDSALELSAPGGVGIGTAVPTAELDVNGATRTTTLEITGGSGVVTTLEGWGWNDYGQINVPLGAFVAVAGGGTHSVALHNNGTLIGWGANGQGQIDVPDGTYVAVAAGAAHNIAIRSDGTLNGWGWNLYGQIDVPSGMFIAVAAGADHSLAIRSDGTIAAWGSNGDGQINSPSGRFLAVAAGGAHSLAIRSDGTLAGWGYNANGQVNVPSGTFVAVAAGGAHSLAIRSDGTLVSWGINDSGQLNVPSGTFVNVVAGQGHSLAIRNDGSLAAWGWNMNGQIDVPSGTFVAIAAGGAHSLAIRTDPDGISPPALVLQYDSAYKPGSNTWTVYSDRRLKKDIEPLSGALDRLLQLRGVTFQWRDPASQGGITGTQMGLIADEVQRAFPQWVGRDGRGYKTLTVSGFEALTAEAMRELREEKDCQIQEFQSEISNLKSEIAELKDLVKILAAQRTGSEQ